MNHSNILRRRGRPFILAMIVLACCCWLPSWAKDMSDPARTRKLPTWWKSSTGALLTNANNGKVFAYPSNVADTTGTTIWASYTVAFSIWTFSNFKTDLYTIKHVDDVRGTTLLAEGYLLEGSVLGDGQIDRAAAFGDSVIPPRAFNPDSTYVIDVAVDKLGGLETVDDSLNIKLNGTTLALSTAGLKLNVAYGKRDFPYAIGQDRFYVAGADTADAVFASWSSDTGIGPYCVGTGSRDVGLTARVAVPDTVYVNTTGNCTGGWAGGDPRYSWMVVDP